MAGYQWTGKVLSLSLWLELLVIPSRQINFLRASLAEPLFFRTEKTEFSLPKNQKRAIFSVAQNNTRIRNRKTSISKIVGKVIIANKQ
jgi:hypothetical protein